MTNKFFKATGFDRALLAMAASIGLASAQTQFMISSVNSSEVLTVPNSSKSPGEGIQQSTALGGTNQQWTLHRIATNDDVCYEEELCYEILSISSGMALTVNGASTTPGAGSLSPAKSVIFFWVWSSTSYCAEGCVIASLISLPSLMIRWAGLNAERSISGSPFTLAIRRG